VRIPDQLLDSPSHQIRQGGREDFLDEIQVSRVFSSPYSIMLLTGTGALAARR